MLSARIIYVFFVLLMSAGSKANMPDAEFTKLSNTLAAVARALEGQSLSNKQMMTISGHLMQLGKAVVQASEAKKIEQSNRDEIATNWYQLTHNEEGKGNFFSTPAKKKLGVYAHSVLAKSLIENEEKPFPAFDAKTFREKIGHKKGLGSDIKLNRLLLAAEVHFRTLMKKNEELVKTVKYIGLRTSSNRVDGHVREVCNADNLQSTKAIFESCLLGLGVDIGMHTVILDPEEDELKLFEALLGRHIFGVQVLGASAVIADKKAHARIREYLDWEPRKAELLKLGLDTVVEEQMEQNLACGLPFELGFPRNLPHVEYGNEHSDES